MIVARMRTQARRGWVAMQVTVEVLFVDCVGLSEPPLLLNASCIVMLRTHWGYETCINCVQGRMFRQRFVVFLRRYVYPCPPCVPPSHVDAVVAYLQTVDEALPPPLSHSPPKASAIALSPSVLFTFAIEDDVSHRLNQSSSCAT